MRSSLRYNRLFDKALIIFVPIIILVFSMTYFFVDFPEEITLTGVMGNSTFPVSRFGSAPAVGDTRKYIDYDVLTLLDENSETVYLYCGGRTEMMLAGSAGGLEVSGVTFDEINDAFRLGLEVEVKGKRNTMTRNGEKYEILHVSSFRIIEQDKLPLIIYSFSSKQSDYTNITEVSNRLSEIPPFSVGWVKTGEDWSQVEQRFTLYLRESERFRFSFNASSPVTFEFFAPDGTIPSANNSNWGDLALKNEETEHLDVDIECHKRGVYHILFSTNTSGLSDVDLEISKLHVETDEVFFIEGGGVSTDFGGMGFGGFYPTLPMEVINIGKTWSSSGLWSDRSYKYETTFSEGEEIRICFNATSPIKLKLTGPSKHKTSLDGLSIDNVFTVPETGSYEFNLDANQTALISFRCFRLTGENYIGNASYPLVLFSDARFPREPSWIPVFTPQTITGSLDVTSFPVKMTKRYVDTVIEEHDVLSLRFPSIDGGELILYTGLDPDCILYPEGGNTMIQDLSLKDFVNAYEYKLTVTFTGFQFKLARNGSTYQMFHINGVTLSNRTQLPLENRHTLDIVSGRSTWSSVEDSDERFPVEFNTGYTTYEDVYGNQVHNFQVYLVEGEKIRYHINASNLIDFRFYNGHGYRGFNGDADDYLYMGNKRTEIGQIYTATKTGAYYFAVRGYSGDSGTVVFDCKRLPT